MGRWQEALGGGMISTEVSETGLAERAAGLLTGLDKAHAVAARLAEGSGPAARLKPDEWTSGPHLWLIDAVGEPRVVAEALAMLVETRFKDQPVRIVMREAGGGGRVDTVQSILAKHRDQQVSA